MEHRLTHRQKFLIRKFCLLLLSAAIIVSVFLSIPYIARALPVSLAGILTEQSETAISSAESSGEQPLSPIMGESFSAIIGFDYESEPSIPLVENPSGALYVNAVSLCWYTQDEIPNLYLLNRTDFDININNYSGLPFPINNIISTDPMVLIIHTHGTESYLPTGVDYYMADENFRSEIEAESIVAVGTVLANEIGRAHV